MGTRTLLILLLILTGLWFWFCHHWYCCKIIGTCSGTTVAIQEPAPETPAFKAETGPLLFNWTKPDAITGNDFASYKQGILANMKDGNMLEITGHYFKGEPAPTPDGFDNMGMARAEAIKNLFAADVAGDRMILKSKLVGDREGIQEYPFRAADIRWLESEKVEVTSVVQLADRALIYFPYNSTSKIEDPEIDAYLNKLAKRLKETGERVTLTGHTDNRGDESTNNRLGKRRARAIKRLLTSMGVSSNLIIVGSEGERKPVASNDTEQGMQRNRRVEVVLDKKQ